jgi:uncharacterized protein (TIGR02145 family)
MNPQKYTTFKAIIIAFVLTITTSQLFAQTTNGIFFQAVARDNFSNPAKDRQIYVVSSIIQSTANGTKVLIELHKTNTDAMGVFNISLGNGTRTGGSASSLGNVDWSKGPFFLNLKIAITPFSASDSWDYTKELVDMGTTSFGTVPFALYSASSAKVDNKLDASDTTVMLKAYAKAMTVQSLESSLATKLTAADTLTMLAPYAKAAYTIDSSFFKSQLATKLSLTDTINYTKQNYTDSAIAKKLNIADSTIYVTKAQLASYNFSTGGGGVTVDTSSLSKRINLKANNADLDSLTTTVSTKLNIKDTANLLKKIDTASLSSRINLKLDASQLGIANGVASLNASGIIPSSQLPAVSISSTSVVSSDVDMIALSNATVGSIAIRTDVNKNYILSALPASILTNWVELLTPAAPVQTVNGYTGSISLSKVDIDLSNVNNTSDLNKPISTKTQAALDLKLDANKVGAKSGVASLNALGKIPTDQIPAISFSSVKVLASEAEMLALTDVVVGSVVIRTDKNKNYVLAVAKPTVLANWIELLTPAPPVQSVNGKLGNVAITKTDLELENVNNTSDANKPVSTAAQTALDAKADTAVVNPTLLLKAPLASPKFTGSVAIGTSTPASAAALDITSTTQGLLLPRLTYVQKTAIVNPVAGLILFCSDCGTNGEMQLYNGTSFVNMIGATAQFAMPAISSTTAITAITNNSATSGGVINSDGGASITARGIVWGTNPVPTIALATKTTDGTGVGTYTSSITGLTSGVTYYVRAYATNSLGTKYGSEIRFNTAQALATLAATSTASAIGATTATSGGNITYNGGATVTVSGVVWSTTSTPTTALATKTTNGAVNGVYTNTITGLTPGTLYYVRSYATNSVGTSYGAQTSFTTLNTPTISGTASATSISSSTATLSGTITADGGASITTRGLVYGTSSLSSTFSVTSGTGTGTYTINLTGLNPATTYYVRSFATNSVGTVYGTETSFTTIAVEPTVSATAVATTITGSSATSGGTISSNGGSTVTVSGIVWSTTSTPTIALSTKTTNGALTGTYTSSITGLAPATLYYVRAYATNSIGTAYGPQSNFTTLAIAPTISATASATSITSSTATIGGTITSDGGASVTTRGVVYGTSTGSATYSVTSGTGTGTYTIGLTGLTPATTYYARSFATNSVGTVYGTETSFTTIAIAPTLTTTVASSITKYAASAGGIISSNGGSAITASGICWSTTATPSISDSKTTDGTTSGTFTSSITGLTAGITYYVRAYATNAIGTSYGAAQSFTTLSSPPAQTTVLIGTQRWTDKNLNVANYRNGDAITYAANATQWAAANAAGTGAYTYLKFASGDGGATYGKLYNWHAVNDPRGLAPAGYHIPTLTEWSTLRNSQPLNGTTLKSNTTDWSGTFSNLNNNITVVSHPNYSLYNGTNSTGFNALPSGSIFPNGTNGNYGTGSFWTATVDATNNTKAEWMYFFLSYFYIGKDCCNTYEKEHGMSVRLVKDNNAIETSPTNPVLASTTSATSITANSAILGGNITDEGATQVSARGLVYGTTTGASTFSVTVGSGGGTFTATLIGLTQGATYFVRSFATNAQGTGYGAETSFTTQTTPTVSVTATPSSLTTTSAVGGGTIGSTGGATITTSGLVWDANINPTIALATKTTDGATSGTFTSSITGLIQGATYHVRAYATNYLGTTYGPDITFTTLTLPTVSATATISAITGTTATGGGTITSDGGATVTTRGVVWGTTTGSSTFSATSGTGTGSYLSNLSGLTPATIYYVRAFATNSVGTVYGPETSFTSTATAPILNTTAASSITQNTAISGGTITSNGGSDIISSGICWSTSATPTIANSKTTNGTTSGTFTSSMTGLALGTTYYVRAYATNAIGTGYGAAQSFTTLPFENVPTAANPVTNGLMLYLDATRSASYSGSGNSWGDISGLSPAGNATLVGSPSFGSSSLANGSGSFTFGTNVNALTTKTYTIDNEITYIAWVNPSQSFDGGVIVRRTDPSFNAGATSLYLSNNNLSYDWDNGNWGWRSNLMVPNNQWSMIVISVNAGSVTAYLCNATGINSVSSGRGHSSLASKPATNFHIGYDPYNTAGRAFKGKMGTAMVYSVALSSSDITAIFNAQKASFGL